MCETLHRFPRPEMEPRYRELYFIDLVGVCHLKLDFIVLILRKVFFFSASS